ncbi:MAG TPA: DNA-processing protein DprA [Gemmatimonadales bacterium]
MSDLAYIALAGVPGIGRARLDLLLAAFGDATSVLRASPQALASTPGISRAAATAIRRASLDGAGQLLARTEACGGQILLPDHPAFPTILTAIPDAPVLLFALGRTELLGRPALAVVGSREHTRYGAEACRHLAGGAARAGLVIVSGMARGIDALAHRAALEVPGDTIGVLGNGFGVIYPSANRELYQDVGRDGCFITEFPPGERPNAGSFPRRNRLISGLARATLVIEARERSGALITVDCALAQGREVMAVPGPITSPVSLGCNRLIQHGAKPALGLRDILEEYGLAPQADAHAAVPSNLTDDERQVLTLVGEGTQHVDAIAARVGRDAATTLAVLTSLEIRGLVAQDRGMLFRRAIGSR